MGFLKNFRRRMSIFKAFEFGRKFFGIDLEYYSKEILPVIEKEVKRQGDPIPSAVFFMLVPAYLGIIDESKRYELYDVMLDLRVNGHVNEEIYNNFMLEFDLANLSHPREWVEDAIIGAQSRSE